MKNYKRNLTILLTAFSIFALICVYGLCQINSKPYTPLRDYQIDLYKDTVWVYDEERFVGRYTSDFKGQIDSILLDDNQ